jgi:hypothetical protein
MLAKKCSNECSAYKYLEEKDLFYCSATGKVVEQDLECLIKIKS